MDPSLPHFKEQLLQLFHDVPKSDPDSARSDSTLKSSTFGLSN
jgi:hypothetical protein